MDWQPIGTLKTEGRILGVSPCEKVDLYSDKWRIRWMDCGWSVEDECWYSATRWVDEQGRRSTQFREVLAPSHWTLSPELPKRPVRLFASA